MATVGYLKVASNAVAVHVYIINLGLHTFFLFVLWFFRVDRDIFWRY
jgi:hypothetical protein